MTTIRDLFSRLWEAYKGWKEDRAFASRRQSGRDASGIDFSEYSKLVKNTMDQHSGISANLASSNALLARLGKKAK